MNVQDTLQTLSDFILDLPISDEQRQVLMGQIGNYAAACSDEAYDEAVETTWDAAQMRYT